MSRGVTTTRRPLVRALLGGAIAGIGATACLNDSPVAAGPPTVRATLHASVVGAVAGGTVGIRVGYRTSRQLFVPLPSNPQRVSLAAGQTVAVPVTVDIGPCLADDGRALSSEPGCLLTIELTLTDATGETIDRQTREASSGPVTPGQSVDFGTVTIGITVSSITVAPASLGMSPTEEQRLTATVRDGTGAVTTAALVGGTITDGRVAQLVTGTAGSVTVRALKLGTATITATAGGKTSSPVPVNVVPPAPLVIRQRQGAGCLLAGQTINLDVDSPPGPVTWSSANTSVATVSSSGVVTGIVVGQAVITATSGLRTGTATVCVTGPLRVTQTNLTVIAGQTVQISATGVTGGVLSYASSAPTIASVDASGLVRGIGVGQSTVTVTFTGPGGAQSLPVQVTVNPASIAISPTTASAALTRTTRYDIIARDATGATIPNVSATWTIDDATVGALSATSGAAVDVRALKVGTTIVRATVAGQSASAQFVATQPLPAARLVKVSGDGAICPTRTTACTFVVRAVDVNGAAVAGASVSWSAVGGCGASKVLVTDDNGLSTAANICSVVPAGTYSQVATLLTNQQQAIFTYTLRGVILTLEGIDQFGSYIYSVTSPTVAATGLKASVDYKSGPAANYVTGLDLRGTTTPTSLTVTFNQVAIPFGTYTFDVVVSTTTPGIGPGMVTITFVVDTSSFFIQPNERARQLPRALQGVLRSP
jgi:uncharacterized protein YjdB